MWIPTKSLADTNWISLRISLAKADQIHSDKEKKPEKQDLEAATIPEVKKTKKNHLDEVDHLNLMVNQEKIVEERHALRDPSNDFIDQETISQELKHIRDHFVAQAKDTTIPEKVSPIESLEDLIRDKITH